MPDGQVGFVGKNVAEALGYERPDNAIRTHVDDEDKLMHQISASGQKRNAWIISETAHGRLHESITPVVTPHGQEYFLQLLCGEARKGI